MSFCGHALLGDEALEHARHAGDVIGDQVQLRGPPLGPDRLGLDLAAVELGDLAVDRLGVAAVPGELELGELAGELELLAVDVLVVVHEQPDRVVRLVTERARQRGEPVGLQVLRLVDDERIELRAELGGGVDQRGR